MKLHSLTLILAVLSMRCPGTESILAGTQRAQMGVQLDDAADVTALIARVMNLTEDVPSYMNSYIDLFYGNTTTLLDFYSWNAHDSTNSLAVAVVCPSNSTGHGGCGAWAQYNGNVCTTNVCPFEIGTKNKEVTADCSGFSNDFPFCSFFCSTFETYSGAFNTCFASSPESPTSAPTGPTSSAPISTYARDPSLRLLPVLLSWIAWMGAHAEY